MDVLLLAQDVTWDGHTGDAVHLRELANRLARRGNGVRVVARAGAIANAMTIDRVEVHAIRTSLNLAFSFVRRPLVVRAVFRVARARRPDIVYSRSFGDPAEAILASALGVPIVYEVNGDAIAEREAQLGRPLANPWKRWAVRSARRGFRRARSIVVVTETLRRRLIDQYDVAASKVRVIENAADTDLFRPSNPMLARSSLGLGEGPVVLFVGNLAPWQGVDVLVRAFKVLSRHNAAAHLVVVGDGQTRPGLEELVSELGISKQVRFLGAVPYEQVPTMIAAADVCVAPMTRERLKSGSSAIKVHEYLACERPVVASRIPGLEFLETEGVGILVPPEDEQALASALARVLEDAEWRRSAGARGRALVLKKASWTSVAEAVEEVCLKAVTA